MAKYEDGLDDLAAALAGSGRRQIVALLCERPASTSELADALGLGLPGVTRHLDVLREAGVVRSSKSGRVVTYALDPESLRPMSDWIDRRRSFWTHQLDALHDDLTQENS
ncbi:metalloregulator ArsR/SmtB family transcription factor [Luteipulveratus sp. YIM 133132]|uniref:ArsR/SmtB family transcription factor n=1 Tax=Luteipulveratus flavus TaxID=3031728 RepID=UPI0023B162BD|nr:metalloregulator ArsR/SmtB family transcription factor [Luteipulveratus sp. YIM 133132]MDE9366815.1 metalloregulator ArsR/SmtB family transcription factor [Luteipulveratus sp. YIM 133132]